MTTYSIETMATQGPSAGVWELEPNGAGFESREDAESAMQALIADGYDSSRIRVIESA